MLFITKRNTKKSKASTDVHGRKQTSTENGLSDECGMVIEPNEKALELNRSFLTRSIDLPFYWIGVGIVLLTPLLDYVSEAIELRLIYPRFPDLDLTQHGIVATCVGLIGLHLYTQGMLRRPNGMAIVSYFFLMFWLLAWMPCLCAVGRVKFYLILCFSVINFGYFVLKYSRMERADED
jgi:hypothetical protein